MFTHPELKRLYQCSPRFLRSSKAQNHAAILYLNELLYERLFSNALARFGIENRFYPIKSAATFSLLYLVLRVVTELPVKRILETGAGQTTLLLDALNKIRHCDIHTLEHDASWATKIQSQVAHPITHTTLIEKMIHGYNTLTYQASEDKPSQHFDLLIIDGPVGNRRKSRWGCLEIIENVIADDFVIIFDDAARKGELETIEMAIRILESQGKSFSIGVTESATSQCVLAGGKYADAAFY